MLLEQIAKVAVEEALVRLSEELEFASLLFERQRRVVDDGVDELHESLLRRRLLLLSVLGPRHALAVPNCRHLYSKQTTYCRTTPYYQLL